MSAAKRGQGDGSIYQLADGRWRAQVFRGYSPAGSRLYRTKTVPTKTAAKTALRDLLRDQHAGTAPEVSRGATVKSWAEQWLTEHQRNVRPKTYSTDAGAVRRWIVPAVGGRRLDQITPADVRSVAVAVERAGRSESTARHAQGVLVRILRAAQAEGYGVPPRALAVQLPTRGPSDRDAIPLPDVAQILRAAADLPHYTRWLAALLQGMRQAEALGLTWEYIDLDRGTVDVSWQLQAVPYRLPADPDSGFAVPRGQVVRHLTGRWHLTRPKTAAGQRIIPLVPAMADHLAAWRDHAPDNPWGLVWAHVDTRRGRDGRPVPRSGKIDRAEWDDLQDTAHVAHVIDGIGRRYTVHEARHTTATLLLAAGVDQHVVTSILGHSSIAVTRGYQHVNQEMKREAMQAIAAQLAIEG